MKHPIPPGSRDILPEELGELRALQAKLAAVFERFGYGEVATPTIEYDEVLSRGDYRGAPAAHRFFDEGGELLAMRSDMTVPIARLIANRFAGEEQPLRFFYNARAFRAVRPQRGQMREFFQAGVELIGIDAPGGTIEVVEVLSAALDAAGLGRAVIGLGDADLYRQLLAELGVGGGPLESILDTLARHDLVGLESKLRALDLPADEMRTLVRLPELRGGAEVLEEAKALGGEAVARATARLAATYEGLAQRGIASRVRLDLGLLRDLGYYTGAILEVYDPAVGHVLGGGGRYDELMGRFGRELPAAGFGLYLERVHIAQAQEEMLNGGAGVVSPSVINRSVAPRQDGALRLALPRGALFGPTLDALERIGVPTAEMRGDSRSLVFEAGGLVLVTMRPSDVPTYVEAGAADLGITGKDVLIEQGDRVVYELADLGYGRCRMVLAAKAGDDGLEQAERRLGAMRIATKYPRMATEYFERTGRQVEVIEVKGSVELAPLAGLSDGIVDLVDTGRTMRENGLEVREEIVTCTARLVANRVAHKLRAAEVDDLRARLRGVSSP